jgi:hypothetical protein
MHYCGAVRKRCFLLLLFSLVATFTWAQSETATVSGQVVDPSGLNVTGAQVKLVDIDRDTSSSVTTNTTGLYTFPSVKPGRYRMEVIAAGFKVVNVTGVTVNVQDHLEQNFKLVVGSISESITVEGGAALVDTESATVSTVVDRNFAENLPMNGRSFQTLVQLTPGVVVVPSNPSDSGQFSVNGQRAASNYWMVDGVSANIGIGVGAMSSPSPGNGLGGASGSFSAMGGTNSLVSVDAMQEFRIQTSTYAPEFGRTPGGQISIVTRSGTNQFHGTVFDYVRNDLFDANDWFNGYTNNPPLPKAKDRQNDFGSTFSGPILKDRTFFFFSYEGLRLRLPQTTLTTVPDLVARQTASPAMKPYLNAFPFDPTQPDLGNGVAQFNASYSNPATLDAYSIRIDHKLTGNCTLFGRYNYSPSQVVQRGAGFSLNTSSRAQITTETATLGTTWLISPAMGNDLRFNYSRTDASSAARIDNFGGAVPLTSDPFPTPFTSQDATFELGIFSLTQGGFYSFGKNARQLQQQLNIVDNLSIQRASHSLKVGVDFRRLAPLYDPSRYSQEAFFSDVGSAESGSLLFPVILAATGAKLSFRNLGIYAQDTWRIIPRLTLTYGVRWDVDFAPESLDGPGIPAITGFDLNNLSNLALAPYGTHPFTTRFGNFAPRLGIAYQFRDNQDTQTVLRGGIGVFYDLATSEMGNLVTNAVYPFGAETPFTFGGTFPLDPAAAAPPSISPPSASNPGGLLSVDPHLRLPYTLEWNVAVEQALGKQQTISASYIGARGTRLLETLGVEQPNPSLTFASLVTNAGESDYDALQLRLERRLSHGLQVLASYTWSHSIDTGSAGSNVLASNSFLPSAVSANRARSDFDIRNGFSAAMTYEIPALKVNAVSNSILSSWSIENILLARSSPPVDVSDQNFSSQTLNGFRADVRPDLVPGQPVYLQGSQYPGGLAFNQAAFTNPPTTPTGCDPLIDFPCNPSRQGNLGRNGLRGFGATQWDFAVHRDFPIGESVKLQFRVEMFNVLNHPNFGPPNGFFGLGGFGLSNQTLAQYLNGGTSGQSNAGGGAFSPLYQIGGPRSMQFALKLSF